MRWFGLIGTFVAAYFLGFIIDTWNSTSLIGQIILPTSDALLCALSTYFVLEEKE